ncbi:hypothetical protein HY483_00185 [Candidatus Woesearchaeota archaeon]|nr:hypothetical protein [Candidatus Woesearchaeota archaeon]
MTQVIVSEEKFRKVLSDVETLITDVSSLFDQDSIVKKRILDIQSNPQIGRSEKDLDEYLKKRGVAVE